MDPTATPQSSDDSGDGAAVETIVLTAFAAVTFFSTLGGCAYALYKKCTRSQGDEEAQLVNKK